MGAKYFGRGKGIVTLCLENRHAIYIEKTGEKKEPEKSVYRQLRGDVLSTIRK